MNRGRKTQSQNFEAFQKTPKLNVDMLNLILREDNEPIGVTHNPEHNPMPKIQLFWSDKSVFNSPGISRGPGLNFEPKNQRKESFIQTERPSSPMKNVKQFL